MTHERFTGSIISDFNASNFAGYLANDGGWPEVVPRAAPYGQVAQAILGHSKDVDFAFIWTQPQSVLPSFRRLLDGEVVNTSEVMAEVDEYLDLVLQLKDRIRFAFVPTWVLPHNRRLFAMNALSSCGADTMLMRANLRLCERLDEEQSFFALNAQNWVASVGKGAFNPKLWYMSKVPFANQVFREAVLSLKGALRGVCGRSRKLIVLDLDETLWGGIVGDDGWENLQLGGHDPIGEAFVDFQRALKGLMRHGVLLGIVSKNTESVALEAIEKHPEMVLGADDFAGWRINWNDKAQNLADLVAGLNLGLDSAVFIDDNPVERARVRDALPQVAVPHWPKDKTLYRTALTELPYFDFKVLTEEDRQRTKMYVATRKRQQSMAKVGSFNEWLETLGTCVTFERLNSTNLGRTVQLLNKTNQMNLTTRRIAEAEFEQWANTEGRRVWVFRVTDKFGDQGLTGVLSLDPEGKRARIVDFILSCRVMGRRVEETMVSVAIKYASSAGFEEVLAQYLPTKRNLPCLEFWKNRSSFEHDEATDVFRWFMPDEYQVPRQLVLQKA